MKNIFDMWYGGKVSSRQAMQDKVRGLQTSGSVISELNAAIASRTPADKVESAVQINKERKWTVVCNEKSAPYVGERY